MDTTFTALSQHQPSVTLPILMLDGYMHELGISLMFNLCPLSENLFFSLLSLRLLLQCLLIPFVTLSVHGNKPLLVFQIISVSVLEILTFVTAWIFIPSILAFVS
jgi:hypothetical protein